MNGKLSSPTWVGLTGIALALAAGFVFAPGSGDEADAPPPRPDDGPIAAQAPQAHASAPAPVLEHARPGHTYRPEVADMFAGRSWEPPAPPPRPMPPAPPAAPPEPVAPPLPFAYVGKLAEEGQEPVYYLEHGPQVMTVRAGADLAGSYRFIGQTGNELEFTYLPLNTRQTIRIKE